MSYEGSMKGSGIYSEEVTLVVDCECGKAWEEDFVTDDWGRVSAEVKCSCGNEWTFTADKYDEDSDPYAPDRLEEM